MSDIGRRENQGGPAAPDLIGKPAPRPVLKLRSVSMREGPPDLLSRSKGQGAFGQPPGMSIGGPAPEKPGKQPLFQASSGGARAVPQADDDLRPAFTIRKTPRPTQPERGDPELRADLPRTRYRSGHGLAGEPGPPPTPAVAVRLRRQRLSLPADASPTAVTPLRRLDEAVRLRLWDQFSARRPGRPPSAGG